MEHIIEPYRLSLLDVLKRNLKTANRVTYLHRIIYVCNHSFPNYRAADEFYQDVIKNRLDAVYLEDRISGLLLYYPEYLCSILESSEQAINRVLTESIRHPDLCHYVHKRKLLAVYHNINQRLLEDWMTYTDKPPTLLEKIEPDVDRETAMRYVYNCIKKLYGLVIRLRPSLEDDMEAYQGVSKMSTASISLQNPARLRISDFLPEYSLLDFLLKTEHTEELNNYVLNYGHIPDMEDQQSLVWPRPPSYVPFNVFDSFQDPIQDLPPRELIKLKEVEVPKVNRKETKQ